MTVLYFTGRDNGSTIEEYIKERKSLREKHWKFWAVANFEDEAATWWELLNKMKCSNLPNEEFEKFILDRWSHARKQDNEKHVGLFSTSIYLLQVHGLIQKEKIIVSINPSCQHNFINVNLEKQLQVPTIHIENIHIDNEDVQVYKDLRLSMDNYVFHSDFYDSDMANVDVVLEYPCMESMGTININVQKKFLKLWYKKKRITLQDISINKQVESMEDEPEYVLGTDTLDDEPLMVDNQTQTSNQVLEK